MQRAQVFLRDDQKQSLSTIAARTPAGSKTTLVKTALPDYRYVSLENPETRQFSTDDPAC